MNRFTKYPLLLVLLAGVQFSSCQPAMKLAVYSRVFTPGIVPVRVIPDENGNRPLKRPSAQTHHYIYVSMAPDISITPLKAWIGGQSYAIKEVSPVESPVLSDDPEPRVLVNRTTDRVFRIEPADTISGLATMPAKLAKQVRENEFVLQYRWKEKIFYKTLARITVLPPFHAQ